LFVVALMLRLPVLVLLFVIPQGSALLLPLAFSPHKEGSSQTKAAHFIVAVERPHFAFALAWLLSKKPKPTEAATKENPKRHPPGAN
jgi:hypothetical protein